MRYLGGRVQTAAGDAAGEATTREASDVLLRAIRSVKTLGGTVSGRVVRIPPQHAGTACVEWLATHGYRVIWT